jgi:O-antigen/teichoic acid export membrane protein
VRELKSLGLLVGSGLVAQGIMLLGTLAFARLYGPASFGELGYFAGFASVVAVIAGARFDYFVFSSAGSAKNTFFSISLISAGVVHVAILVLLIIAHLTDIGGEKSSYWLVVFSFAASIFYLSTQMLIAVSEYERFARLRLLQAVLQIVVGLLLFQWQPPIGLFCAYTLSQLAVGIFIVTTHRMAFISASRTEIAICWRKLRGPAAVNSIMVLLQYSTPFAPILLGSMFYAKGEVGAYFVFSSAVSAPLAIYRRSVLTFLNAEAHSPGRAKALSKRLGKNALMIIWVFFAITLLGSIGIWVAGKEAVAFVFGVSWREYSNFLLPIFVYFISDALLQPFTTLLPLWGHQAIALKYEVLRFGLVFLVWPLLAVGMSLSFAYALLVYFMLMFATYLATFRQVWTLTCQADSAELSHPVPV